MILTHSASFPSAKILRDAIIEELGWEKKQLLVTKHPEKITKLHLRFGNSGAVMVRQKSGYVLNPRNFISVCADKKAMARHVMKDKSKMLAPNFVRLTKDLPTREDFPFLVRNTLRGSGSKGIMVFQEFDEFLHALANGSVKYASYWTPYIRFTEEFRVHVLGGRIGKIFRKQLNDEEAVNDIFIRNNDNSHFYRIALENTPESVVKIVKKFDSFFKRNFRNTTYFTALDIGIRERDNEAIFIEANTAPGLNKATAKIYAKFIIENSPVFAETEKEIEVINELKEQTKRMNIEWALEYEG